MKQGLVYTGMAAVVLLLASTVHAADAPESIGYNTVADALKGISQKPDVQLGKTDDGWTLANDAANQTLWTFSPATHPAYPAVVKRRIVDTGGEVQLRMAILCEAAQAACDQLKADYEALNQQVLQGPAAQPEDTSGTFNKVEQEAAVLELTAVFWQHMNSQQYQPLYTQFSPQLKKQISLEQWAYSQKQVTKKTGAVQGQAAYRLTWYENPPQLPAGWYAVVDYATPYERAQLCGFIVWQYQPDNSYLLQRIENNVLENTTAKGMSPQDVTALKQRMGCRL